MAIRNPQPAVIDGVVYDLLGPSLAMSTSPRDNRMVLDIAVTFTPYRDGETGPEILEAQLPSIIFADAMEQAAKLAQQGDLALARFLARLEAAAQEYVDAKV
jgi:hypothetical protein